MPTRFLLGVPIVSIQFKTMFLIYKILFAQNLFLNISLREKKVSFKFISYRLSKYKFSGMYGFDHSESNRRCKINKYLKYRKG